MGAKLYDYTDLFREAANALRRSDRFREALRYYEPLQQVSEYVDASYLFELASCYGAIGLMTEAENCYSQIVHNDGGNYNARLQLAEIRRVSGATGGRYKDGSQGTIIKRHKSRRKIEHREAKHFERSRPTTRHPVQPTSGHVATEKQNSQTEIHSLYFRYQNLKEKYRNGDVDCKDEWMAAMKSLHKFFINNKVFYPIDKHHKFYGYSKEARALASRLKHDPESLYGMKIERSRQVVDRLIVYLRNVEW